MSERNKKTVPLTELLKQVQAELEDPAESKTTQVSQNQATHSEEPKEVSPPPVVTYDTAEEQIAVIRQIIRVHFPNFVIDQYNGPVIDLLSLYFFRNPEFEKTKLINNPSLHKGILLGGPVGTGKTVILELFSEICRNFKPLYPMRYGVFATRPIARKYTADITVIDRYGAEDYRQVNQKGKEPITRAFDGISEELMNGPVRYFGNFVNVFKEILTDRYDHFIKNGMLTHGTTNSDPEELERLYSAMLFSRFRQMFNSLEVPGADRRAGSDAKFIFRKV